jgi:hypothetical protein
MRSRSNGRVRRTASEWREILDRFEKSQLSAQAFCKRESLSAESFRRWRSKLARKVKLLGREQTQCKE